MWLLAVKSRRNAKDAARKPAVQDDLVNSAKYAGVAALWQQMNAESSVTASIHRLLFCYLGECPPHSKNCF